MKIRLGYVAISKTIDFKTSGTLTYTDFCKNKDYKKLNEIILSNLENLKEILLYNKNNNIHFYRITSKLIPLATKEDVSFDYINPYIKKYKEISEIIKNNKMRVDFHPDQFCVLNSTKKEVVENTKSILEYHYKLLDILNIKNKLLVLHIGSNVFGKEKSLSRFIKQFNTLPKYIQECIAIENDDKIFNVKDCLYVCNKLNIPLVLDYHHHLINNDGIDLNLDDIWKTWKTIPKIHFSSPKNKTKKDFRAHNDYIDIDMFLFFIEQLKKYPTDLDIMIEAKAKDEALFRLIRQLKYKTSYNFLDETSFYI